MCECTSGMRHRNSGLPEFRNIIVQVGNSRLGCAGPESILPTVVMDSGLATSSRPGMTIKFLTHPQPLVEGREIDQTARMMALADPALAVEGFDLEPDHPARHRDHPRGGPYHRADR
jgi:hypothetical protein